MNARRFLSGMLMAGCAVVTGVADVILVPADYATIQEGIDAAVDGDMVLVADGEYGGAGNLEITFAGKAITVCSASGPANCVIDCDYAGAAFIFENDEGPDSVLRGFTIADGYS